MILSGQSIRKRNIITPFNERTRYKGVTFGVGPAGYDIRIAETKQLKPGECVLVSSVEKFTMPDDVLGKVADKSTWARQFIAVQNTVIEPGWRGFLTLEISNHGHQKILIEHGVAIAQIIFHLVDEPVENPYEGKYQDQKFGATEAIFEE